MSDATSSAIRDTRKDWMVEHRTQYLQSGGAQGHIMDVSAVGGYAFAPHCLIKYVGRKSGRIFITPLCYIACAGEVIVCASKGGADHHPEWYLNLISTPQVEFQVATQAFSGTWREPDGDERTKLWNQLIDSFPFYAQYQTATRRIIPLVMMRAVSEIPVFREEDATGLRQM